QGRDGTGPGPVLAAGFLQRRRGLGPRLVHLAPVEVPLVLAAAVETPLGPLDLLRLLPQALGVRPLLPLRAGPVLADVDDIRPGMEWLGLGPIRGLLRRLLTLSAEQLQATFDAPAAVSRHVLEVGPVLQGAGPGLPGAVGGAATHDPGEAVRLDGHE